MDIKMYYAILIVGAVFCGGFLTPPGAYGLAALYGAIWGMSWYFIYHNYFKSE